MSETRKNIQPDASLLLTIKIALENAEAFLNDASLLFSNSSFGHAVALTILALEEMGKAVYCNWAIKGFVKIDDDFFERLKTHKVKQRVHMEVERLAILSGEISKYQIGKRRNYPFESGSEELRVISEIEALPQFRSVGAFYKQLDKLKQLALYVDLSNDGVPFGPTLFTKDICQWYLDFAQKRFLVVKKALNATS